MKRALLICFLLLGSATAGTQGIQPYQGKGTGSIHKSLRTKFQEIYRYAHVISLKSRMIEHADSMLSID